ncbi:tetratricopeptide repeat protein [Erythrobacter vulgaris]|uniref:Tetratricopeptide repeat protein n=1 Tax=Qipengyuania vulgaris TaxID=291985 RepID=A0A844XRE5_9SPHN|nr:tetratricopeptide repeat-containing sulfotransferase family protein [Qipengyuania vulgaris]MXO47939.1 tetratricopeptide repeat protein [Qipengyuania vulgaris]
MNTKTIPSLHPGLFHIRELLEDSKFELASQQLIGFLRNNPGHPQGLAMLGEAAAKLGALGQAEHFLRKAINAGVRDHETRRQLASVFNQQAKPEAAREMFEALNREKPDPNTLLILAAIYEKTGRGEKAGEMYRAISQAHPEHLLAWVAFGHSLRANGQVDDAVAAYRQAIRIDDGFGDAWWGLASIKSPILTDEDVKTMQAALAIAVDERNSAPLHFALARAFHDRRDFGEAFEHYRAGNQIRAESLNYDPEELTQEVDEIISSVDADYIARLPQKAVGDAVPVFIVSMPRSGSTLLEQMLGSHSQIEPAGELPYIPAMLRSFMEMATRRNKVTVTQAIHGMSTDLAEALGKDYMTRAAVHLAERTPFFIDKMPPNWSNVLFIRKILPQARFISIRRDAMDCCFSNFTQSFTSAHASSFTLEHVGRSYVENVRLMDHFANRCPGLVHPIDYAALVEDPQGQLGPTLEYLGLEWENDLLEFHRLKRTVRTPSSEQVRRPLNRDGMEVWRPYSHHLEPLRKVLGSLAET